MDIFLFLGLISFFIGIILFIKEKRSLLVGFFLISGILETFLYLALYLTSTSIIFTYILLILILLIILAIIISGFLLVKNSKSMKNKEGSSLANKLSLFVGLYILTLVILLVLANIVSTFINPYTYSIQAKIFFIFSKILSYIFLFSFYFGFLFFIYIVYSFIFLLIPYRKRLDYIIVLGSGLIGDKVPPLLQSRLNKGMDVYKKQIKKGFSPKILVSGGQGPDELTSEACAMKKYLLLNNIPDSDIITESKSTSTYENMKFSKNIMDNISANYSCIFVTNNYHVFRAALFARKAHLKAHGLGSKTAGYFLPSAIIREFIAILVLHKWFHLFITLLITYNLIKSIISLL